MKKFWFYFDLCGALLALLTAIAAPFVMRPLLPNAVVWTLVVGSWGVHRLLTLSKPEIP